MSAQSKLRPFLRDNLDILFIGLNPAKGSSDNEHYFSVNQAFWNQLKESGLISAYVDKKNADEQVFGNNKHNYMNWEFGITDLVPQIAESDSRKVKPVQENVEHLLEEIIQHEPKVVCLLHMKVFKLIKKYISNIYKLDKADTNSSLGCIVPNLSTYFFKVAFPHGNIITSKTKVLVYKDIKEYLIKLSNR